MMRRTREERDHDGAGVEWVDDSARLIDYPPHHAYPYAENFEITIGDLHGNALKLLYFLIRENILLVSQEAYQTIVAIYCKDIDAITKFDLMLFRKTMDRMQCASLPKRFKLRLMGDELADRGSNDYFTLLLFEKLKKHQVPFEILFSNHGYEFISVFERGLRTHYSYMEEVGCANSLTNLRMLVERGLISMREVSRLVKTAYLPYLKLLSYSYTDNTPSPSLLKQAYQFFFDSSNAIPTKNLVLYSHARIGLRTVVALKRHTVFRSAFIPRKAIAPGVMIELINARFAEIVKDKAIVSVFANELEKAAVTVTKIPFVYAVLRCLWNRGYQQKDLPVASITRRGTCYHFFYVHGHDGCGYVPAEYQSIVTNLDNGFGKYGHIDEFGRYSVLYSKNQV